MTAPLLQLEGIDVDLGSGRSRTRVVHGVSLDIGRGETVGLIGESGSGKTTIGRAIIGLVPAAGGRISFAGDELRDAANRRRHAGQLQMVFQDPYSSLNPALQIGEIVAEPLRAQGVAGAKVRAEVALMLDRVGLPAASRELHPAQFSGGQRQRIAIARALITRPQLVICDEATSALDLSVQAQILTLLRDLQAEFGQSYLFIGHNIDVVRTISHRIAVLNRGRLVEVGPAAQVASTPTDPYTQRLLMASLSPDPRVQAERRDVRRAHRAASHANMPAA